MPRFDLYQPTIMPSPYTYYQEYQPSQMLRPYICCYWSATPFKKQIAEYTYEIIPDGCSDIVIEYDLINQTNSISYYGLFENYFKITEQFTPTKQTFGIRFYPGSSAYFVRERAKNITGKMVNLEQLHSSIINPLFDHLQHTQDISCLITASNTIFSRALMNSKSLYQDSLLNNLLHQIFASGGTATVGELSTQQVVGKRKMSRLFEERIGLSPKKFSQVIRFQSVLTDMLHQSPTTGTLEYYDQSHLIKDFKKRIEKNPSSIKMSDFYNTSF
ncbi:helix-turn-helix domain-containing protein [Bacillus sp. RAR_GA_16]|uniref:helix-turn-helix domain-containing protein n=1 Tax=Bacillus sp. RAR_GA_16 TaxID=2876774 RepID=UPI001CCB17DE|nr:helix-turn-helix domain-containing protein [Bacillus sp. RAR_GA_16]MCA0173068.1 helix-turn-helix domain-containing protein [Bacillus sp. RAR_GA_16]